jgi:hypothetical protein
MARTIPAVARLGQAKIFSAYGNGPMMADEVNIFTTLLTS